MKEKLQIKVNTGECSCIGHPLNFLPWTSGLGLLIHSLAVMDPWTQDLPTQGRRQHKPFSGRLANEEVKGLRPCMPNFLMLNLSFGKSTSSPRKSRRLYLWTSIHRKEISRVWLKSLPNPQITAITSYWNHLIKFLLEVSSVKGRHAFDWLSVTSLTPNTVNDLLGAEQIVRNEKMNELINPLAPVSWLL